MKRLANEEIRYVVGGNRYCIFEDGSIAVAVSGQEGVPAQSLFFYSWDEAKIYLSALGIQIGLFTPSKLTNYWMNLRDFLINGIA